MAPPTQSNGLAGDTSKGNGWTGHDIIVLGASAGGVEALAQVIAALPSNLPAAVFVTLHCLATFPSSLPNILSRAGKLPAEHAVHGDLIRPGRIYVAPPDNHLMVDEGFLRVVRGPKENGHRPAVDALFRTAARAYGPRVIGVVLSGYLDDGTLGLILVKSLGGVAVIQDPATAISPDMPHNAMAHVDADHVLAPGEIGHLLGRLAREPVDDRRIKLFLEGQKMLVDQRGKGKRSMLTCPECNGSLIEVETEGLVQFRCHVGHTFSLASMLSEQADQVEAALWAAVRALEESESLARRMSNSISPELGHRFHDKAEAMRQHAALIRRILMSGETLTTNDGDSSSAETPSDRQDT